MLRPGVSDAPIKAMDRGVNRASERVGFGIGLIVGSDRGKDVSRPRVGRCVKLALGTKGY